ncbi:MAG TPA: SDR family oxidoreductase [Pedomonas sp.]|uniref:SDR family NAD(P)-dependent oxidoreductase n=1 Tax=Pedomonas sp. TaxID=2976421 RepID=UPI002F409633
MSKALAGKVAFVTGGSGGIGSAVAESLLRDGASVLIMGRRQAALEDTRRRLLEAVPDGRVEIHAGDALSTEDVQAGLARAHAIAGRLDILVPAVGGGGFKPLLMHDADSFRAELDNNIISAFLVMRYGAPLMTQGGSIVCISSTAGVTAFPWLSAYCTGKAGLEALIRTAADELSSANIRVNAVRPGMTRTEATGQMFDAPDVIGAFLEQIPLGRGGDPADIAAGVRFLAGPESGWVTGQSFAVDGGHELRRNPDLTAMVGLIYGEEALAAVKAGRSPE